MSAKQERTAPSPNGPNGRDGKGRFAKGNRGGPGNPLGKKVAGFRKAMFDAVDVRDLKAIVKKLIALARAGEAWAIREVLDRCVGRIADEDAAARIQELENLVLEQGYVSPQKAN